MTNASAPEVLVEAVDAVACGKRYLSHDVAQTLALVTYSNDTATATMLSTREFEVLKLLAQGFTLAEIADQLGVAAKTIANHQSAIKQKLGAGTGRELVRHAIRLGIVPSGGDEHRLDQITRAANRRPRHLRSPERPNFQ